MSRNWFRIVSWHLVAEVKPLHEDVVSVETRCGLRRNATTSQIVATDLPDGRSCESCFRAEAAS